MTRRNRRGREARPAQGGSRFERFLLSIMGPAQIGEDKAPDGYLPDPAAEVCHRCGRLWSEHERLHKDSATYLQCPPGTPAGPDRGRPG